MHVLKRTKKNLLGIVSYCSVTSYEHVHTNFVMVKHQRCRPGLKSHKIFRKIQQIIIIDFILFFLTSGKKLYVLKYSLY